MNGDGKKIETLLIALDKEEHISLDLGTPQLHETDTFKEMITIGKSAVPQLLRQLHSQPSKKITAYIVMALGRLSDISAYKHLIDLQTIVQQREPKDKWDYAILSQCKVAINNLQKKS